jgi:hypothetical protein
MFKIKILYFEDIIHPSNSVFLFVKFKQSKNYTGLYYYTIFFIQYQQHRRGIAGKGDERAKSGTTTPGGRVKEAAKWATT